MTINSCGAGACIMVLMADAQPVFRVCNNSCDGLLRILGRQEVTCRRRRIQLHSKRFRQAIILSPKEQIRSLIVLERKFHPGLYKRAPVARPAENVGTPDAHLAEDVMVRIAELQHGPVLVYEHQRFGLLYKQHWSTSWQSKQPGFADELSEAKSGTRTHWKASSSSGA